MKLSLSLLLLIISLSATAQTWAVTQKGDTIYIYDDGTWSFDKDDRPQEIGILDYLKTSFKYDTISTPYSVSPNAKKNIASKYGFFEVFYDENVWRRVPPAQLNDEAEFAFMGKDNDIYVAILSEEIEIGLDNIYKIAKNNIEENLSTEVDILKSEIRNVNGSDLIRGVMSFDLNGLDLVFDSYYYSDERGTVQFTTWTATNLHEKYETKILELLNGIVIKKK